MAEAKAKKSLIEKKATNVPHIFLIDIDDSGYLVECAVVKEWEDGSISYIRIDVLHPLDKARIKKVVTKPDAERDPLWKLLAEEKFSNGLNALDFCHANFIKIKRPKGAVLSTNSILSNAGYTDTGKMIGSDFVNPAEANFDPATRQFIQ